MHIVFAQQRQRFLHSGSLIQDHTDGCGGGDVHFFRLLVRRLGVDEENAHGHALFIDAVQGHIGGGQTEKAVQKAGGQLVLPKADVGQVDHGDGAVAVGRRGFDKKRRGVIHIKIPSEDGISFRGVGGKGRAAQIGQIELHGQSLQELSSDEADELRVAGGPCLQKVVKAVIPDVLHGKKRGVPHPLQRTQGPQFPLEQQQDGQHQRGQHGGEGEQELGEEPARLVWGLGQSFLHVCNLL